MSINVIASMSFGVGTAASPFPLSIVVEKAVLTSINVIEAKSSLDPVVVVVSLGGVISVIGERSSLDVAVTPASGVVMLGNVPLAVGKAETVMVRVVVMVTVRVRVLWNRDLVPQSVSRGRSLGVTCSKGATRARVEGRRVIKIRTFMMMVGKQPA
jgi:uncharacterized membrane protein